jgi:hypothetical protein
MKLKLIIAGVVVAGFASACNSGGTQALDSGVGTPSAAAAAAAASSSTDSTPSSHAAAAAESWVMPNERGKDLQSAQDDIQSITNDGIFFTRSHDATGRGRHQILDRDWQVCSQNVRAGSKIVAGTDIVFNVVRVETESCP